MRGLTDGRRIEKEHHALAVVRALDVFQGGVHDVAFQNTGELGFGGKRDVRPHGPIRARPVPREGLRLQHMQDASPHALLEMPGRTGGIAHRGGGRIIRNNGRHGLTVGDLLLLGREYDGVPPRLPSVRL